MFVLVRIDPAGIQGILGQIDQQGRYRFGVRFEIAGQFVDLLLQINLEFSGLFLHQFEDFVDLVFG